MTPELWHRVDEIFAGTEGLSRDQVKVYLDRECSGNSELRREVEALLSFAPNNDSLLHGIVEEAAVFLADSKATLRPDPAERRIGLRIGPYRLTQVIGAGGMGVVYLAERDDDQYQKKVAIKLVQQGRDTKFIHDRFRQERQILAQLDHPNIARFIDGGVTEDGLPYYAMEFVEDAQPIVEYCQKHQLPLMRRLALFLQICTAVNFAHRNLVVHRDLKPGNILVDRNGCPKLLDFGIAKLLREEPGTGRTTQTGVRMMTPDYASPEQVLGVLITTATDVYSLGAILYEMVSDQPAHRFKNYSSTEIERVICVEDPVAPSQALLLAGDTPERQRRAKVLQADLDSIVAMALRKEPDRRYQSVSQLIDDLDRFTAGQPVLAHRGTIQYVAGKFIRRHKLPIAAAAMVVLSLIGGIAATAYQARRAENRFQQVRELANTLLTDLDKRIETMPQSMELRQWMASTVVRYLDNLAKEAGGDHQLQFELAQGYYKIGMLLGAPFYSNLGQTLPALENYRKAASILVPLAGKKQHDAAIQESLCATLRNQAALEVLGDNFTQSRTTFELALRHGQILIGLRPEAGNECLAGAYAGIVNIEMRAANPRGAIPYLTRQLEHARNMIALRNDHSAQEQLLSAQLGMAQAQAESGHTEKASDVIREAAEIGQKAFGNQWEASRYYIRLRETIGDMAGYPRDIHLCEPQRALENFRAGLAVAEKHYARDSNDARARRDVDRLLRKIGLMIVDDQPREGMQLYRRALALSEINLAISPSNPEYIRDNADGLLGVGYAFEATNHWEEALAYFQKALQRQMDLKRLSPEWRRFQREFQETYEAIGDAYLQIGRDKDALASYEKGTQTIVGLLWERPTDPYLLRDLSDCHHSLANYYAVLARRGSPQSRSYWKQAIEYQKKSLQIWTEWPAKVSPGPYQRIRLESAKKNLEAYEKAARPI
ncbi:MAG TPA: serine/threonine-protein kinase [Bryobacteraceae bacterium]|nr:serine/threonine-protein kinase [Bryobacteraceae bacterium]